MIKVEICCGTACYLLGAAKMMNLEDQLPSDCRGRVEGEATPEKVVARVRELLEGVA